MSRSSVLLDDGAPHSGDCALASKSAAAFAASNVSAVPLAIRSSRLLPTLALRLTSHVGTPSCVNTNNMNSPTSVQTAGSGPQGRQRLPFEVGHVLSLKSLATRFITRVNAKIGFSRPTRRALNRSTDRELARVRERGDRRLSPSETILYAITVYCLIP